jgi:catechol 2,3-dioxygenase-like lactoylglutathione lyase family enzyme
MSSAQTMNDRAVPRSSATVDQKVEVVALPVADVERAKRFYESLGWRVDADFAAGDAWRLVQMTPPGSSCSVMFGKGFTTAAPGSMQGTFIVVDEIETARADLLARGVEVSDVFHFNGDLLNVASNGREPGRDPQGRSYFSFASFSDPDGNSWLMQEVTTRFAGRGFGLDAATMTTVLQEAEKRHGEYEPTSPHHHWSEWYAAFIVARAQGRSSDEAAEEGARRISHSRERVEA